MRSLLKLKDRNKPTSSDVLTCYLKQCDEPPWTSYFIKVSHLNYLIFF